MSTGETSAADPLPSERSSFRAIGDPYKNYQDKRRLNALQRQQAARLRSANRARTLALEPGQQEDGAEGQISLDEPTPAEIGASREDAAAEDAEMEPSTSGGMCDSDSSMRGRGRHGRGRGAHAPAHRRQQQQQQGPTAGAGGVRAYGQRYGNELMQPEWMTDVPSNLATDWLVMPRPEGMRCLLVTSRGRTASWLRNGAPLHRFASPLPGGSPAGVSECGGSAAATAAAGDYCLLDCIFHPPNNTYYVLDLLCWRGYALYDTAAEFRTFWLTNKFREEGLMPPQPRTPAAVAAATAAAVEVPEPAPPRPPAAAKAAGQGCHGAPYSDGGDGDTEMGGGGDGGGGGTVVDVEGRGGSSRPMRQHSQRKQQHRQEPPPPPSMSYRIVPLPVRPCTLQGLRAAYGRVPPPPAATGVAAQGGSSDPWVTDFAAGLHSTDAETVDMEAVEEGDEAEMGFEFVRDGLYFLHRQGHYCPGSGTTPLALLWKDLGCSRYLLDTDATGQPLEHQAIVLSYRADRTVATEDEPPIVLGRLPEAFVAAMGDKLKPGRLLRFSVRQGGLIFHEGRPAGADLHYEGPANQRRGRADSFSKILFQWLARTAPITASNLAAAAAAAAEGAQAAEGAEGAPPRNAFGHRDGLRGCSGSAGVVMAAAAGGGLVLGGGSTGGLLAAGDMAVE